MESLAAVLRGIPLFAGLPPGSFARIIADLREERYASGAVICREGDPALDFYIVKSGETSVFVNRAGEQRELIAINRRHEWFGERALFSDAPRAATVVATTDVELWRLPKDKFAALIEENPLLMLHFARVTSDRLYRSNRELSKLQATFAAQTQALFAARPAAERHFLTRTSVLSTLEAGIVEELLSEPGAASALAGLEREALFVARRDGLLAYTDAVRDFLVAQLREEVGDSGVAELRRRAASLYERTERWEFAVEQHLAAGDLHPAARLLGRHAKTWIAQGRGALVEAWLRRFPEDIVAGELARATACLKEAETASTQGEAVAPGSARASGRAWLRAAAGVGLGLSIWFAPPLEGLGVEGMRMLGLLAWAAVFWALDILPDYVVGIGMILGWILFGVVPADVAVSGFTAGPFFLIIGVLGIGASLQNSGLLFRLALQVLRRFPLSHRGQATGLALTGTAITPGIPDSTSGAAIAGPIVLALSDCLGYARRSNGSAGLAMAAVLGFGQMSPFFLTGAAENLLAYGLLPPAARAEITWGSWALAALPMALATFVLGLVATLFLLPPESQPSTSRDLIETQIEALGRTSRAEWLNAGVLGGALVGWVTAPYHGIDVAWVAMIGMALLLAGNLLDRNGFRSGIYWDFLFYLGAVLSLTGVVRHLGVDTWVIGRLTPIIEPMTAHPSRFLLVLGLVVFAARFVLPSFPLVSVLVITVVPIAMRGGIHPLVLTLVICTTVAVWFLPYQSTYYLALYFGTKEQAFTHRQVRWLAWSYGVVYLAAIAVAIPYWHWLDLLP